MRNIWRIFCADLKGIRSNVLSGLVAFGLLITPSLYAWFNILGFWDPYSNTDNLKVAVADEDQGYSSALFPTKIDAGQEIVAALHNDHEFDWEFTGQDEAIEGVKSGKYFAALVIPEEFSADLMTIFSGNVKQAEIEYYTNQKINAVAPKVTTEGATELSSRINQKFSEAASEVGLSTVNDLVDFIGGDGVANYGRNLVEQLGEVGSGLGLAADEAGTLANLMDSTGELLIKSSELLGPLSAERSGLETILDQAGTGVEQGKTAVDEAGGALSQALTDLEQGLDTLLEKLEAAENGLGAAIDLGSSGIGGGEAGLEAAKGQLKTKIGEVKTAIRDLQGAIEGTEQRMGQLDGSFGTMRTEVEGVLVQTEQAAGQLGTTAKDLASNLNSTGVSLRELGDQLTESASKLAAIQGDLKAALDSGDISRVRQIIGNSPANLAAFIAAPAELEKIPVYAIADNGSAMAPFYTSLAIWVGSIFLVALMETGVGKRTLAELEGEVGGRKGAGKAADSNGGESVGVASTRKRRKVTPAQLYLGRYLIFLLFALAQATIVCFGDLFFLGVQCDNFGLFFLTGWVCALVFSLIVYTLTISFSKVGESLAIILVVLQVASAGGIFPVVLSAPVFQAIYPWLPFVYSMNAFQGAMAGVYGDQFVVSILTLLVFVLPMLVLGLVLRRPVIRLNDKMVEKMEETGVM